MTRIVARAPLLDLTHVLPDGRIDPAWPRHGYQATDAPGDESAGRMIWVAPDTLVTCSGYDYPDGVFRTIFQRVALTPTGPQSLWGAEGIAK